MKKILLQIALGIIILLEAFVIAFPVKADVIATSLWLNKGTYVLPAGNKDVGAVADPVANGYFNNIVVSGCTGCGGGGGGGSGTISTSTNATIGKVAIWTGLATLGNGSLLDNGTVAGVNASSSTVNFLVQGTGSNNPFQINNASGTPIFVVGVASSTQPSYNISSSSGASMLAVAQNGNVGIGTTTPSNALTVIGSISASNLTSGNCLQASTGGLIQDTGSACGSGGGGGGSSTWTLISGGQYNSTTTDVVLIGTTTPTTAKLFVQGSGTKDPFNVASSSGASNFVIKSSGNIGVNTANPSYPLIINNNSQATGTVVTSDGTYLGDNATFGVFKNSSVTGDVIAKFGSSQAANQFEFKDLTAFSSTNGFSTLGLAMSTGTDYYRIKSTNNPSQYMDVDSVIGDNIAFNIGFDPGSILFNFGGATVLTASSTGNSTVQVKGFAGINPFDIASSSGISVLRVLQDGTVGIGTTTTYGLLSVISTSQASTTIPLVVQATSSATTALLADFRNGSGTSEVSIATSGTLSLFHLAGGSGLPTIATSTGVGVGSGTSASLEPSSTDLSGLMHWKTTNAPVINSTIVTTTFSKPYINPPFCTLTPGNSTSTVDSAKYYASTTTTTLKIFSSVATAITASTTYDVYFSCFGKLGG